MGAHLIGGEFQSDKYPTTPLGKVPLSTKDPTAQDLLWEYAQRRRAVDAEFSEDLEAALVANGYVPKGSPHRGVSAEVTKPVAQASDSTPLPGGADQFVVCRCGHIRPVHTGCGQGHHVGSPHDECCDECGCVGFVASGEADGDAMCGLHPDDDVRDASARVCYRPPGHEGPHGWEAEVRRDYLHVTPEIRRLVEEWEKAAPNHYAGDPSRWEIADNAAIALARAVAKAVKR